MKHRGLLVATWLFAFLLAVSVSQIEVSSRTTLEILEVVLVDEGYSPVVQGDGLWNPNDRDKAPMGLTPSEMRLARSSGPSSFIPSGSDFIILDPRISSVIIKNPMLEIKGFVNGWTVLLFNPNPSFLPPKLTLYGKFTPNVGFHWNEILNLAEDDRTTMWINVSWSNANNYNQEVLAEPKLDVLFPYWEPLAFTYLYIIEVAYYSNDSATIMNSSGTVYMYQLIFEKSDIGDGFWLYSYDYPRSWWFTIYLALNVILISSLTIIMFQYKRSIKRLRNI